MLDDLQRKSIPMMMKRLISLTEDSRYRSTDLVDEKQDVQDEEFEFAALHPVL